MPTKLYEAMFVIDSNKTKDNYETLEADCKQVITRFNGEIVGCSKWDDRRLAYEINKIKRGTYVLIHFNADTSVPAKIERQVQMSENIARVLITVDADGIETNTGSSAVRPVNDLDTELEGIDLDDDDDDE